MIIFYYKLVFFICLVSVCSTLVNSNIPNSTYLKKKDDDNCDILLESFATATSNFTFCAIRYARPIKLCQKCVEKYQIVESVHTDILTLEDEEGEQCRAKLINLDRLQVVEAGFNYVDGLWKRAACNNCYKCDDAGNPTKELNQNTKEILNLSNITQACIENHIHDLGEAFEDPKVCSECKSEYLALNSRYDSLKERGFCMDIVDLMNSTRAQWSTELSCCLDRRKPEWLFLVSTAVFTCLPLVLYLAAFLFVSRKEQTLLRQRRLFQRNIASSEPPAMMSPD